MKQQKRILSISQKKRLIQWEIPHLIQALKKEHQIVAVYLSVGFISSTEKKISFIFDGKTFFPLSLGKDFLGFLVCFYTLSTFKIQRIENFINSYLKKVFTMLSLPRKDSSLSSLSKSFSEGKQLKDTQLKHIEESETKELDFLDFDFSEENSYFPINERKEVIFPEIKRVFPFNEDKQLSADLSRINMKRKNETFFPFLVERGRKEELLKTAYSLYLKSSCFAFLNTEALEWKEKIFQELNGIFVCVPSFQNLSVFQREILIQDLLQKKVSCPMVLGVEKKERLPSEYQKLFHTFV